MLARAISTSNGGDGDVIVRWVVAAVHLLALGMGLGAVWTRARALKALPEPSAFGRAFAADGVWGLAALLWISTGLWRAFGGLEKGPRTTCRTARSTSRWACSCSSCCWRSGPP